MHEPLNDLRQIESDPYSIKAIENPTVDEQLLAVRNRPDAIQYISNPAPEVIDLALDLDPTTILMVPNPTFKQLFLAYRRSPESDKYLGFKSFVAWVLSHKILFI